MNIKKSILFLNITFIILFSSQSYSFNSFSNCYLDKVSDKKWRAKFDIKSDLGSSSNGVANINYFYGYARKVNSNGYPDYTTAGKVDLESSNVTVSGTSLSFSNMLTATHGVVLKFHNQTNTSLISPGTYHIEFDISLLDDTYPGVFFYEEHYYPNGAGGQSRARAALTATSNGTCWGQEPGSEVIPPIEEIDPPEPDFKLSSAIWELEAADLGDLPNITSGSAGYKATIINVNNNRLCIDYVTAGIKKKEYALGISNDYSSISGHNVFKMLGENNSQLLYDLDLKSTIAGQYDFSFPSSSFKYIALSQAASNLEKRSQMCWFPEIKLYKEDATQAGMHTDTLNFIIIPKA
ncbi:hypothetical protein ACBQ54_20845 [Providencia vermicola]|uniref:hypothetical protein n=1 Tax=Providencia vermicola TaxID=333965 RepID=UPI0035248418